MKTILCTIALVVMFSVAPVLAADSLTKFSIDKAMASPNISALFPGDVAFFWGDQQHPPVTTNFGNFKTSKRTSALGKGREKACSWAMASALEALQNRAYREGGNAVINIVSNIKGRMESSTTQFSCLAGSMMVNVAIKGDVVTLAE